MKKNLLFLLFLLSLSTVYAQVPNSPILVLPPEEASVVSITPDLQWESVSGADCYFIYITNDTNNLPSLEFCMTTTNSYSVPLGTLVEDGNYYWCVKAHNGSGWGAPSAFSSFKTVCTTPQGSIENLQAQVTLISTEGRLSLNQANILNNRLESAVNQLNQEHEFVALLNIGLFKLRVFILRLSGLLPEADATSLNYSSDGVIDLIQTVSKPGIVNVEPPREFALHQNYPNPFNPSTTIEYTIPNDANVSLKIYDITGKEVASIIDKFQGQGSYIVNWNASNYSSGVYVYKLTAGSFTESKKMVLSK